jgi:hypothetical protein
VTEYRSVLERAGSNAPPPDLQLERVLRRRDRKRRNQRIAAGVVGIAVFVAAIWIVTSVSSLDRSERVVPAQSGPTGPVVTDPTYVGPSYTLGPVTPKDVAVGESFMDVWADGDGEAAATMFSAEGTFDGFKPGVLPALHDWFRAEGWTFEGRGCGIHGFDAERGVVGCTFTYENDLTRALGMPSVETTFSLVIGAGGIEAAWYASGGDVVSHDAFEGYRGNEDVFSPVWDMFIDWISSRHPDDFGRIYDSDRGYPILDPSYTELWKRYTAEFVASPQAQALAQSNRDAGWDGVGFPPEGTAPSSPVEGELVAHYDARLGPSFAFVYADGRVISGGWIGDSNGTTREQRLTPEGVELVRSGAVEPERFALSSNPVPAGAWENPEFKPYVPSRYAVCYWMERSGDYVSPADQHPLECSEVTTDQARALDNILRDGKVEDAEGDVIFLEINTLLPHGEWVGTAG